MSAANGAIPYEETKTAFSVLSAQFPSSCERLKTKEFIDAALAAVSLIERFGKVFAPVTYDMNGNIRKITNKYEQDRVNHEYLEDMILKEQTDGEMIATDALMWLRRALHFICAFFQSVIDDTLSERCSADLTPFVKKAYSETLEEYHGWLGTQLFNVLSRFAPNRRDLFHTLALQRYNREENVIRDMQAFTRKLNICVRKLIHFYSEHNLETFATV